MNKIPEERGFGSGLYKLFFSNTKVIYRFFGSLYYVLVHTYTFILKYLVIPAERRSVTVCASSLQCLFNICMVWSKTFCHCVSNLFMFILQMILSQRLILTFLACLRASFRNLIPLGTCKSKKVHVKLRKYM